MQKSSFELDPDADRRAEENRIRGDIGIDAAETDSDSGSTGYQAFDEEAEGQDGEVLGGFADFVRRQPVLTLSVAFGLGLIATSLLTGRRS